MLFANASDVWDLGSLRERRRFRRFPIRVPVRFQSGPISWTATSVDVSVGGLLATASLMVEPPRTLDVSFTFPGTSVEIVLPARVVRLATESADERPVDRMALAFRSEHFGEFALRPLVRVLNEARGRSAATNLRPRYAHTSPRRHLDVLHLPLGRRLATTEVMRPAG